MLMFNLHNMSEFEKHFIKIANCNTIEDIEQLVIIYTDKLKESQEVKDKLNYAKLLQLASRVYVNILKDWR